MVSEREAKPPRKRRFGKNPGQAAPDPVVGFTRATVALAGHPLEGEAAIEDLRDRLNDDDYREELTAQALAIVNRALHAASIARVEPHVGERGRSSALAIRWGYGTGEELASGQFTEAREESPGRRSRRRRIADAVGQERFAAMLGAHEAPGAAETLVLRARLDLDGGRAREAAVMIDAAAKMMGSGRASRRAGDSDAEQETDLAALQGLSDELSEIASDALRRAPGTAETERIREACQIAERILRRRKHRRG